MSPLADFGQTGTLPNLYCAYRLDVDAIVEAAAELLLDPSLVRNGGFSAR